MAPSSPPSPACRPHTLLICLAILLILTIVNLRGVHDTGVVFIIPTYLFLGTLLIVIAVGIFHTLTTGGHPVPVVAPPKLPPATAALSLWLILKVFASGCTAMTGVEAVSNGVKAFREPTTKNARLTLTIIIALLIILLAGIALLCRWYGIGATDPEGPGYQSVLSQLTNAVMGHGVFYWVTIASILLVLSLSANTAFADFPRLTRAIALHDYLPHVFFVRGRRLLYSYGIAALVTLTACCLFSSEASPTASSPSTPSEPSWPSLSPRPAWSCTGSATGNPAGGCAWPSMAGRFRHRHHDARRARRQIP